MPASQAGRRRFESGRPLSGTPSPAVASDSAGEIVSEPPPAAGSVPSVASSGLVLISQRKDAHAYQDSTGYKATYQSGGLSTLKFPCAHLRHIQKRNGDTRLRENSARGYTQPHNAIPNEGNFSQLDGGTSDSRDVKCGFGWILKCRL